MTREEAIRLLGVIDTICTMRIGDYGVREHKAILMAIEALGNDTNVGSKWIPVSKKLPKVGQWVLLQFANGQKSPTLHAKNTMAVGRYDRGLYGYMFLVDGCEVKADAWQPLPEPYKGE